MLNKQLSILSPNQEDKDLLTVQEASKWATSRLGKNVSESNISYLIQYGRIRKIDTQNGARVSVVDLENYYASYDDARKIKYKESLGDDINWALSFSQVKEAETTKHVHRLHPYKGKFIPQLVEYFIDDHIDNFKKKVYFNPNDFILDPFSGSGTTMVQANELGINAIGIDVSAFNTLIANCKVAVYDITDVQNEINRITIALSQYIAQSNVIEFEKRLLEELNSFNSEFFPVPEYKYRLRQGEINENEYGIEMEKRFFSIYCNLIEKYKIKLRQDNEMDFIGKWFSQQTRDEIDFVFEKIKKAQNQLTRKILTIILSRVMRSCRATTHSDLATLREPVISSYYCTKHGKICKPLFSISKWWRSYCKDTISRIIAFNKLRTKTTQYCITGDSRNIDIIEEIRKRNIELAKTILKRKINGVFSSPPYVGMINYHEQHAYAYDLFGFVRRDELEIGPLFKGKGKEAQRSYVEGISQTLINCKRFFVDDYNVFLVANDRYNLYPLITEKSGMKIVNTYKRPVLNRSEKDKTAYSETIFHIKEK